MTREADTAPILQSMLSDRPIMESAQMPSLLSIIVVPFCLLIAASDVSTRRVPNAWLLIALALGAILLCIQWALGTTGPPWQSLAGFLIGMVVLLPVYAIHWMGAGDVKLFATLGFLLGVKALLPIWLIGSILGGMHAVYMLLSARQLRHLTHGLVNIDGEQVPSLPKARRGTPYAACLSAGALITLFHPFLAHW